MARLVVGSSPFDMATWDLSDLANGTNTLDSATEVDFTGAGGHILYKIFGTGFTTFDANGFPTTGNFTGLSLGPVGSTTLTAITGIIGINAHTFTNLITTGDYTGLQASIFEVGDTFIGRKHDDTLIGFGGNDVFNLDSGGNDTVQGQAGNDSIHFGGALTAADSIDGGDGTDKLTLIGDYSAGVTFGAATMINVEKLRLGHGFDYNLTLNATTVAAGQTLALSASGLSAANHLTLDVSAVAGAISAIGGLGDDTFTFGNWAAGSYVNGRTGDNVLVLNGDFSASTALTAAKVVHIDTLEFTAGHNYHITTDKNFNVGTIDGSALGASDSLIFNGSATQKTAFHIIGGAGNDTLTGNASVVHGQRAHGDVFDLSLGGDDTVTGANLSDTFNFGGAYTSADTINGGGITDTVNLVGDYTGPIVIGSNVTRVDLFNITTDAADIVVTGAPTGGDTGRPFPIFVYASSIAYDATGATVNNIELTTTATTGTIVGSPMRDFFVLNGDVTDMSVVGGGGGGGDVIALDLAPGQTSISAGLTLDSGSSGGTLDIQDNNGSFDITLTPNLFINFTTLFIANDTGKVVWVDADEAAGHTTTILAESPGARFDGSAETDGNFVFNYAIGKVIGGAGNDTFNALDGAGAAAGTITGGGGADTIIGGLILNYHGVSDSTGVNCDIIEHFDFAAGSGQVFHGLGVPTAIDAAVTSGALSTATFDADLAAAIGAGRLAAGDAVVFTADSGTLSGQSFLIVDHNGTAGYQAGLDYVFHLVSDTNVGALSTAIFT